MSSYVAFNPFPNVHINKIFAQNANNKTLPSVRLLFRLILLYKSKVFKQIIKKDAEAMFTLQCSRIQCPSSSNLHSKKGRIFFRHFSPLGLSGLSESFMIIPAQYHRPGKILRNFKLIHF